MGVSVVMCVVEEPAAVYRGWWEMMGGKGGLFLSGWLAAGGESLAAVLHTISSSSGSMLSL